LRAHDDSAELKTCAGYGHGQMVELSMQIGKSPQWRALQRSMPSALRTHILV